MGVVELGVRLARAYIHLVQNVLLYLVTVTGLRAPLWKLFVHILENYRSVLVLTVVMPMSFIFDFFWRFRTWYIAKFKSAPALHEARVKDIQTQVKQWNQDGRKTQMCTARPGWMTVSPRHCQYKNHLFTVSIDLTDILSLDEKRMILRCEPSVNILQILDYCLPRGYTLPIIPELDELTIGGLVNGYGIETSSHLYGLFNDICESFEIVLPDGTLTKVTRDDKLFYAIPWSFGTVGFLTAVELRLQKATKYVRHHYIPVTTKDECVDKWVKLQTAKKDCPDFLEGILYDDDHGVVLAGYMTNGDKPEDRGVPVNYIDWWFKPYFYMHCKDFSDNRREGVELIPLRQYYQRHNRSIFWALQDQIPICNNPFFRTLCGWMLPPRVPFLKLIETDAVTKFYEENYVMQDWLVPLVNMRETIVLCHKELAVYPLWLCPFRVYNTGKYQGKVRAPPGTKKAGDYVDFIDIATIGPPGIKNFNTVKAISTVEEFLAKVGGYQGNYSYTYQSLEQFRKMFDHRLYDEVRAEHGGDVAFPESYFKVARKNQWTKKDK